jgi:hypothetical protein
VDGRGTRVDTRPITGVVLNGDFAVAPGSVTIGRPSRLRATGTATVAAGAVAIAAAGRVVPPAIAGRAQLHLVVGAVAHGGVDNFARARREDDTRLFDLADVA